MCVLAAVAAQVAYSSPAHAQNVEDEFTVQRFDPAPGPRNYFTTRGVRTDGEMAWSAGLFANYGWEPFTVHTCINCDSASPIEQDIKVVENVVTGDALASLTPIPRLQIGLKIPVTYVKGQGAPLEDGSAPDEGIDAVGMGDAQLEAKFRLHGDVKDPFVVGAAAFGTAPLGHATSEGNYIGDATPSFGLRGIFDGEHGPFGIAGNVAGVWRGEGSVGATTLGPEFRYGVALGYRVGLVRFVVDGFGATNFSSNAGENSLEGNGGLQIAPQNSPISVSAGAGTGIVQGVGVPKLRAFLGFIYSAEATDRDEDGLRDADDRCPTDAEDFDRYEDSDGCPDQDNDLDSILDSVDKCPMQAEDSDGFEDTDGCAELDNDKDGVSDDGDRCPEKAETKNGFQDEDGCPDEKDTDSDGVADTTDKCANEVEDTDGFNDTDGCPDPDNDADGVEDNDDECADEAETKNDFEDEDGCPDEAPAPAAKPKK